MHKYTTLYVQKYSTSKLTNFKSDNIRLLLQKVTIYKHILPSETIKHQPYKQILIVCMAGNQYVIEYLSLNTRPR